jgi:hypothetical protein
MDKRNIIRFVIICALLTQISHAAHVFYLIGEKGDFANFMSWVFAVSLETSIYVFTMYGKRNTALFFGCISWAVNLLYYWQEPALTQAFVAMNVISPIIPITIFFYSELIKNERKLQEDYDPDAEFYEQLKQKYPDPVPEPEPPKVEPVVVAKVEAVNEVPVAKKKRKSRLKNRIS